MKCSENLMLRKLLDKKIIDLHNAAVIACKTENVFMVQFYEKFAADVKNLRSITLR